MNVGGNREMMKGYNQIVLSSQPNHKSTSLIQMHKI